MKKYNLFIIITVLMLTVLLSGCTKNIALGGEKLPEDTREINMVLDAQELSSLDLFPALERVDLSGSTCYDEIRSWAQAHPDVQVRWSVKLPDGSPVPFDVKELSLAGAKSEDAKTLISLLSYFHELEKVSFTGSAIGAQKVREIAEAFPELDIEYSFMLFGQPTDYYVKRLDLSSVPFDEIYAALPDLAALPHLRRLELGSAADGHFTWEQIAQIEAGCPGVRYDYDFSIYGKSFNISDRVLDIDHIPVYDEGAEAVAVIPYMTRLEMLDMDSCGVPDASMQAIREEFPDIDVVWRVWFGDNYSVRTDTEKILASKPAVGGNLTPMNTSSLIYCNKVKYLDIGHNEILHDIYFVSCMPELEVAIIAMSNVDDLSPLSNCTKLEYLEIQTNPFTDISPLAGLVNLKHLNMARNGGVTDLSPLKNLTKLERLWIGSGKYPMEQAQELMELLPKCEFNITVYSDPTDGRWRIIGTNPDPNIFWEVYLHPRYEKLIEQFGYTDKDYSFSWNDPKY